MPLRPTVAQIGPSTYFGITASHLRRFRHQNHPASNKATITTAASIRFKPSTSRSQCRPNKYPAIEIVVTHTTAPRKLNATNFFHGMCSAPAIGPATTLIPKTNRAKKTVNAPYRSNNCSPRAKTDSLTRKIRRCRSSNALPPNRPKANPKPSPTVAAIIPTTITSGNLSYRCE